MLNEQVEFVRVIKNLIYSIIDKERLLVQEWHIGKVKTVISNKLLEVYVDGENDTQKIPCNPNVTFAPNDEVFVHFVNRDSTSKFIPYKRGV